MPRPLGGVVYLEGACRFCSWRRVVLETGEQPPAFSDKLSRDFGVGLLFQESDPFLFLIMRMTEIFRPDIFRPEGGRWGRRLRGAVWGQVRRSGFPAAG